ncbi:hypothetical protein BJX62DRAFT_241930 [Aspergillus germanicus]
MVIKNQTPWSHHKLYKDVMLKVMQDTYACCALYITKNPISAPVITSHIYSCYQELILSLLLALALDLVAHTRALLICHIMHLFNPNLYNALTTSPFNSLSITVLESAASLLFSSTYFSLEITTLNNKLLNNTSILSYIPLA